MPSLNVWIERDSKGHKVFVREKAPPSSPLNALSNALSLRRRRSFSVDRVRLLPSTVRDFSNLLQPCPSPSTPSSAPEQAIVLATNSPSSRKRKRRPRKMSQAPTKDPNPPPPIIHGNELSVPPGMQSAPHPYSTYDPGHYHYGPQMMYSAPPMPQPMAMATTTQAAPVLVSDELRYKCTICGRFRSPRYHYRHPLQPGQIPPPTVCGRCKRSRTPSTDSASTLGRSLRRRRYYRGDGCRLEDELSSEYDFSPRLCRRSSRTRVIRRSHSRSVEVLQPRRSRSYYRTSSESNLLGSVRSKRRSPSVELVERVRYREDEPLARRGRRLLRSSSRYDSYYDDTPDREYYYSRYVDFLYHLS